MGLIVQYREFYQDCCSLNNMQTYMIFRPCLSVWHNISCFHGVNPESANWANDFLLFDVKYLNIICSPLNDIAQFVNEKIRLQKSTFETQIKNMLKYLGELVCGTTTHIDDFNQLFKVMSEMILNTFQNIANKTELELTLAQSANLISLFKDLSSIFKNNYENRCVAAHPEKIPMFKMRTIPQEILYELDIIAPIINNIKTSLTNVKPSFTQFKQCCQRCLDDYASLKIAVTAENWTQTEKELQQILNSMKEIFNKM